MKTIEQIKEEIINKNRCTNIPSHLKNEIWAWMKTEFKGKGKCIQIGNMMNSEEFGYCATVGRNSIEVYMTPEDYQLFLSIV